MASDQFNNRTQYYLVMDISIGTQDYANNRTLVYWSVRIDESPEWGSWSTSGASWSAYVAGVYVGGSGNFGYDFRNYNSLGLGSGSLWVYHDSEGYLNSSFSASVGGTTTIGQAALSAGFSAARIPKIPTAAGTPAVSNLGATSMTLTWTAPADNRGAAIDQYLLRRSPTSGFTSYTDYVRPASPLNYTPTDLVPGTKYFWRVYAHNSQGYAPASGTLETDTLSGAYVSTGAAWQPCPVYRSDDPDWDLVELFTSTGTVWEQGI